MPCQDEGMDRYYARRQTQKLDVVTRIACTALRYMDDHKIPVPPECAEWWEAHKEVDRQRDVQLEEARQRNATREQALGKLSDAERRILGL